jgi:hypothetical protein
MYCVGRVLISYEFVLFYVALISFEIKWLDATGRVDQIVGGGSW